MSNQNATLIALDLRLLALAESIEAAKARAYSMACGDAERAELQSQLADMRQERKRLLGERRDAARIVCIVATDEL